MRLFISGVTMQVFSTNSRSLPTSARSGMEHAGPDAQGGGHGLGWACCGHALSKPWAAKLQGNPSTSTPVAHVWGGLGPQACSVRQQHSTGAGEILPPLLLVPCQPTLASQLAKVRAWLSPILRPRFPTKI